MGSTKQFASAFWRWFRDNIADCELNELNREIVNALDYKIRQLGAYSWEIGPCESEGKYLVLSSNGDNKILKQSEEIISTAPTIHGWSILNFKPRKDRFLIVQIYDPEKGLTEYDLEKCQYKITKYENDFDIDIASPNDLGVTDNKLRDLGEISVINALGERVYLSHIGSVGVIQQELDIFDGIPMKYLRQHFDQLIAEMLDG